MWNAHNDGANGAAHHWKIVDVRVLEPLVEIDMDGATALHVNVLSGDDIIARSVVPCRDAVCTPARLRLHLEPFVEPALAHALRERFDDNSLAMPEATVVVCTRNRAHQLDRCLASICSSTGVDLEIIVVDNGDDDGATLATALQHGATYVAEPVAGLDRARNRGVASASHDLILFTDDDVEVDPSWARRLALAFDDPIVNAATGLVLPAILEHREQIEFEMLAGFVRTFDDFVLDGATASPAEAGRAGAGASMAFRRDFLRSIGGFPDILDCGRPTSSGGDTYALYRVLRAGHRVRFEPRAVVRHHHRSEPGDALLSAENYARGVVSYLTYAAIAQSDPSALVAGLRWFTWRVGLLGREWLSDPHSLSTEYVRRQVRGSVTAPAALARAVRENPSPAIEQPDPLPLELETPSFAFGGHLVSVVIATNGHRPGLIQLVAELHRPSHPIEIIVATYGACGNRAALEEALGANVAARVVAGAARGVGDARNHGAAVARGEILLFLDDDVRPFDDGLIARHVAAHVEGHTVAVGPTVGAVVAGSESKLSLSERNWWSDQAARVGRGNALDFTDMCTGNLSINRALFQSLDGFGEVAHREQFELGIRILQLGHTVVGLSDASVWHVDRCTLESVIERRTNEGRADCRLVDVHPSSMFRLGLGTWSDLGSRHRRLVRVALNRPKAMQQALGVVAPLSRLLDRLGSRRRLHRLHDVAGRLAYWSGVGREVGGVKEWRMLYRRISDAAEAASRSVLDLARPDEWALPHSGSHLVDVVANGVAVGVADIRWGGLPFDRDEFARTCAERFAFGAWSETLQPV